MSAVTFPRSAVMETSRSALFPPNDFENGMDLERGTRHWGELEVRRYVDASRDGTSFQDPATPGICGYACQTVREQDAADNEQEPVEDQRVVLEEDVDSSGPSS